MLFFQYTIDLIFYKVPFYFFRIGIYLPNQKTRAYLCLIFVLILAHYLMSNNEKYHLGLQVLKLSLMLLLVGKMANFDLLELVGMNESLFLLNCLINSYLIRKMCNFLFLLIYFLYLDMNLLIMNFFC